VSVEIDRQTAIDALGFALFKRFRDRVKSLVDVTCQNGRPEAKAATLRADGTAAEETASRACVKRD
jgi:hypothetical protein